MALSPELTLQDYWRIIRRRKGLFLFTWTAVVAATYVFTAWQTPVYESHAILKIERPPSIPGMGAQDPWDAWTFMNTEAKSIRSTAVLERTARILGWVDDSTPAEQRLRLANALQGQVQSERMGDSNLLRVSVASDDPEKAAAVANAVGRAYIEKGMEDRSQKARETKEFTFQELAKAEKKLREAEDAFRRYSEQSGARGVGSYLTNQLVTLQTQLDDLLKQYTEQHPDVRQTRAKIAAVQAQLRQLPQEETEYQRLSREVRINEELYTFLAKKYKEAQISEAEREQTAFMDSPALVPKVPVRPNKRLNLLVGTALGLLLGVMVVLLVENLDTSIGTIEDVEHYLELPVLAVVPHISVGEAAGKGLLLSLRLGRAPSLEEARRRLVLYHPTKSSFVEAYHTLKTNLRLPIRQGGRPGAVVGFTSAGVSEGKTLTAANFAITAAQSGLKTLFVEGDLRRPSVHRLLGLDREPGLTDAISGDRPWTPMVRGTSDFLMGELGLESLLKSQGIENFRLLSCGASPLNPADILGSPRFERLLREARSQYDLVVVDCAPVMLFADALLIGPRTDGLILVYKAGRTARGALKRAKDQLANVRTNLLGVVLNDLRAAEMEPHYGYYYYSYRYESPEPQHPSPRPRA